jgi:hypothetical protein
MGTHDDRALIDEQESVSEGSPAPFTIYLKLLKNTNTNRPQNEKYGS